MRPRPTGGRRDGNVIYLSRELAGDVLSLLDAEVVAARGELAAGGKRAGKALALFGAAASILIWLPAILGYVLVRTLAQWMPDWAAGLVVLLFFVLVAGVLATIGWLWLRRVENPLDTITRRLREHLRWWREEVRVPAALGGSGDGAADDAGAPHGESQAGQAP